MGMIAKQRRTLFTANARFALAKPAAADSKKIATLTGYAIVWNALSTDRGGYQVRFLPNSAKFVTPTLALFHHDYAKPLATTANGTLRITPDDVGVKVEIDLPDTSAGNDVEELVERGDIAGMSFCAVEYTDFAEVKEGGNLIMNVAGFVCDEVTVTAIPAFTQTSVKVAEDDKDENDDGQMARVTQSLRLERLKLDMLGAGLAA
jgi:HK97 family phage prohead protease